MDAVLNFAEINVNKYRQNNDKVKKMKKILTTILGFLLLPMLFACKGENENDQMDEAVNEFKLLAIVKSVGEHLEVEVIESDYAFGVYWVITPADIKYTLENGDEICRTDLKAGDKIEIVYGGQVMMSYPPQIVAKAVKVVK